MKILIVGGTGFIGRELTARLRKLGHELVLTTRSPERAKLNLTCDAELVAWDGVSEFPKTALAGVEAVINLAGEGIADRRWTAQRKSELTASRIGVTGQLAKAIRSHGSSVKVVIQSSAIGIYGDSGDEILFEDGRLGSGFLAELCRDWENALNESLAGASSPRTVIFRIGVVLGRGSGFLKSVEPPFRAGVGGRLGSGRQWFSWIHVQDLVGLFVSALSHEQWRGAINAVAPEPLRNLDMTMELARAMSVPALAPAPAVALRLLFGQMSEAILGSQRVSAQKALALGYQFHFPTFHAALAEIFPANFPGASVVEFSQFVARPVEEIFPFFANEKNLETLTPPWLNFRVLNKSTPEIEKDTIINYQLRLHGLPVRWRTRIIDWQSGREFTDFQERGPYSLWHHRHTFTSLGKGTLLRDIIQYRLPMGILGQVVAGAYVRGDVKNIFTYRQQQIAKIFGS